MLTLRIAQAQINPTVGDLDGNVAVMVEQIELARQQGADILTFPECAISGYPPEDLLLKAHFVRDCRRALDRLVAKCAGITVVVGLPDALDDAVYNAAGVIADARLVAMYHKMELSNYGVFDEKRYFAPGSSGLVFRQQGVAVAVTICEDIWVRGNAVEHSVREQGVRLTLNLSGSPFHAGKLNERRQVVEGFARRTGAHLCYTNLVGGQDELVFDGGSLVVDPQGRLVASAKRFEQDLLVTDLEWPQNEAVAGIEAPSSAPCPAPRATEREAVLPSTVAELGRVEEVYQALVLGTRDYVHKSGFRKVVLGLSGGIDSSLTAAVAVEAFGAGNVIGVTMPSQFTSSETRSDAEKLAENLGIRLITLPVKQVFSACLDELKSVFGNDEPGIECENLQARIRGNFLMALSNKYGWMVLTTGNKSETATGYCTLYGDMAGGFAVIKDVPKTLVYELSERVNERAGRDVIPRSVIVRPPTAELRPDQKDEDSLPPYSMLDPILKAYVEEDRSPDDIVAQGFRADMVEHAVRLVHRTEYKRRQAPPGVKITPKAFGRDRRLPITNRYGI